MLILVLAGLSSCNSAARKAKKCDCPTFGQHEPVGDRGGIGDVELGTPAGNDLVIPRELLHHRGSEVTGCAGDEEVHKMAANL